MACLRARGRSTAAAGVSAARRPPQVVVVLSGSMEPGFYRGDILFLYQPKQAVETGDISAWLPGCVGRRCRCLAGRAGCTDACCTAACWEGQRAS